jgi:lysozyme family protein
MADFDPAFARMMANEGGYALTDIPGDKGGQTYAGIARKRWPDWEGWRQVDAGETPDTHLVRYFYRDNFWKAIHGDAINAQGIAETLFDFAVNAGPATAVKLAQIVVGAQPDGVIGPKTLTRLNAVDPQFFRAAFALAKIARYRDIVTRDRSQGKFLLGWINRTLKEAA